MNESKDPVCGMMVTPDTAAGHSTHQDTTYYFCSGDCKKQFDAEPGKFAGNAAAADRPDAGSDLEQHEPPYTKTGGMVSPKFGSAGSGGAEYERLPEQHDK